MPTRILRDGILTSERVNLLDWEAEVFYRRLLSVGDDSDYSMLAPQFFVHPYTR